MRDQNLPPTRLKSVGGFFKRWGGAMSGGISVAVAIALTANSPWTGRESLWVVAVLALWVLVWDQHQKIKQLIRSAKPRFAVWCDPQSDLCRSLSSYKSDQCVYLRIGVT